MMPTFVTTGGSIGCRYDNDRYEEVGIIVVT